MSRPCHGLDILPQFCNVATNLQRVATVLVDPSRSCNLATALQPRYVALSRRHGSNYVVAASSQPRHSFAVLPRLCNAITATLQRRHGLVTASSRCHGLATSDTISLRRYGFNYLVMSSLQYCCSFVTALQPRPRLCNLSHGFAVSSRLQIASSRPRDSVTILQPRDLAISQPCSLATSSHLTTYNLATALIASLRLRPRPRNLGHDLATFAAPATTLQPLQPRYAATALQPCYLATTLQPRHGLVMASPRLQLPRHSPATPSQICNLATASQPRRKACYPVTVLQRGHDFATSPQPCNLATSQRRHSLATSQLRNVVTASQPRNFATSPPCYIATDSVTVTSLQDSQPRS
ncbi:hypothetical protein GGR50DRAFT_699010 [Xylaria sp. CBS 124048]|nr:hypothetical protein GGR50DRAFT_699010 [Xylaria sp. CBS 124048]